MSDVIELSRAAPAVEVRELRKEFRRRVRTDGSRRFGRRYRRMPALRDVSFTMERGECVAILGQNGSGKSTLVRLLSTLLLHDGGSAQRLRPRRVHGAAGRAAARQPRLGRGELLQEDVRRREPRLRVAVLRHDVGPRRRTRSRRILERVGFPTERRGEPMENLSPRDAAEGGARPGAAHEPRAAAARRADDRSRPALEARGAGVHPGGARRSTTPRSCSARTTSPRRRRSPTGSACSTAASCSRSSRSTS